MSVQEYDLAIIGAGSVGLIAADFARKLGARVALLERDRIGGDCTWTGCVPSKSLLRVGKAAHEMRTAARFGVQPQTPVIDMAKVRAYLQSTIHDIYQGTTPQALQKKGIEVLFGAASFVDSRTLIVGETRIRAKNVLVATGAAPVVPSLPGLDQVSFSTYREIFDNERLPHSMAVIGGGPVGVEVAQAYQRLGTQVTLFAERLLPKEEPSASEIVLRVFRREGVEVVPERVVSLAQAGDRIVVHSQHGRAECDMLFVAVGRRPVVDGLNLEAAGVKFSAAGVEVNEHLRTSARGIYAAGDVTGGQQFSHLAGWQGFQAARNALLPGKSSAVRATVPRVTFCDPEVAQVGQTEAEARAADANDVVAVSWPIDREDRAGCDDDRDGMLTFVTRRNGTILGATIVGHRAGEAIAEITLAMQRKVKIGELAATIHPYPTYSTGVQLLAGDIAVERALRGVSGKLIRAAARFVR